MLIEQIIARAEGIPLFIEELTRAAVDADWHDARCVGDPYSSGLPASAVPAALYAPLAARLDRLPDLREVVQVAAVIGREFTFELLEAVGQFPNGTLIEALVRLTEAGLISPCDATRQGGYAFRHALFRDVAYSMLLRDRRRLLHRHVAEALQRCSKEERQPLSEILAHHYTLAELMELRGSPLSGGWSTLVAPGGLSRGGKPAAKWHDFSGGSSRWWAASPSWQRTQIDFGPRA